MRSLDTFLNEKFDREAFDKFLKDSTDGLVDILKGKKLGNMPIENIQKEGSLTPFGVSFSTSVDELQLDWLVIFDRDYKGKANAKIDISSPNKPNHYYSFKSSGKNASPAGVWKTIEKKYKSF